MDRQKLLGQFLGWLAVKKSSLEIVQRLGPLSVGDEMAAFKARGCLLMVCEIHNEASRAVERLRPSGAPMKLNGAWGPVSVCEVGVEPPTSLDEALPFVGLKVVDDPLAGELL
jgi:hypothetical protein